MSRPPDVELSMVTDVLAQAPEYALPDDFSIEWYDTGFESFWIDIHVQSDLSNTFTKDLFVSQFGTDEPLLRERQCFLVSPSGEKIGTTTAWFDDSYRDGHYGRIHWVAIVPPFQGRGLAKPLLSTALRRLKTLGYDKAYLITSTRRIAAINLYLHFGFRPDIRTEQDAEAWASIRDELKYGIDHHQA